MTDRRTDDEQTTTRTISSTVTQVRLAKNATSKCWPLFWFGIPAALDAKSSELLKMFGTLNLGKVRSLSVDYCCHYLLALCCITNHTEWPSTTKVGFPTQSHERNKCNDCFYHWPSRQLRSLLSIDLCEFRDCKLYIFGAKRIIGHTKIG